MTADNRHSVARDVLAAGYLAGIIDAYATLHFGAQVEAIADVDGDPTNLLRLRLYGVGAFVVTLTEEEESARQGPVHRALGITDPEAGEGY